jgi:hypothetical protein
VNVLQPIVPASRGGQATMSPQPVARAQPRWIAAQRHCSRAVVGGHVEEKALRTSIVHDRSLLKLVLGYRLVCAEL